MDRIPRWAENERAWAGERSRGSEERSREFAESRSYFDLRSEELRDDGWTAVGDPAVPTEAMEGKAGTLAFLEYSPLRVHFFKEGQHSHRDHVACRWFRQVRVVDGKFVE